MEKVATNVLTVIAISWGVSRTRLVSYPDPHRSCGWNTSPPTRVVGLVSSCTNFCPVAPECCSDQSDLRYALIAYSSYQSKLSVMAVRLEMDDVLVIRAIQSAVNVWRMPNLVPSHRRRGPWTGHVRKLTNRLRRSDLLWAEVRTKQAPHNRAKKATSEKRCHSRSSSS